MGYQVISDTIQEFNGERFYLCGKEYESKQIRHSENHFCCNNCKCKYGRWKKAGKL